MKQIIGLIFCLAPFHSTAKAELIYGNYSEQKTPTQDVQRFVYNNSGDKSFVTTIQRTREFFQVGRVMETRIFCTIDGPSIPLRDPGVVDRIKVILASGGAERELAIPAYNTGYGTMDILSISFACSSGASGGSFKFFTHYGPISDNAPEFQFSFPDFTH